MSDGMCCIGLLSPRVVAEPTVSGICNGISSVATVPVGWLDSKVKRPSSPYSARRRSRKLLSPSPPPDSSCCPDNPAPVSLTCTLRQSWLLRCSRLMDTSIRPPSRLGSSPCLTAFSTRVGNIRGGNGKVNSSSLTWISNARRSPMRIFRIFK